MKNKPTAPDQPQSKELRWVNLRDSNGRASSLCLNCRGIHPGHFAITGNLEHGATVRCDTRADAVKLADHVTLGSYSKLLQALQAMIAIHGPVATVSESVKALNQARAAIQQAQGGQP